MPTTTAKELFPFLVAAVAEEEEEEEEKEKEKEEVLLPLEETLKEEEEEKEHEQEQREAKLIVRPKDIFLCSKSAAKRSQNEKISRKKEKLPFFHVFS